MGAFSLSAQAPFHAAPIVRWGFACRWTRTRFSPCSAAARSSWWSGPKSAATCIGGRACRRRRKEEEEGGGVPFFSSPLLPRACSHAHSPLVRGLFPTSGLTWCRTFRFGPTTCSTPRGGSGRQACGSKAPGAASCGPEKRYFCRGKCCTRCVRVRL